MKFEDWKYHFSKLPQALGKKEVYTKKLEKKFVRELKKNPEAKKYFETFNPDSVEKFIIDFATAKANFVSSSEFYYNEIQKVPELKFRELSEDCLNLILQKKLFNLQILWLAEKITLPGIRINWDIEYWYHNIRNCPFIDPITPQEIDVMKQFLRSNNCEIAGWGGYEAYFRYDDVMIQNEDGDFEYMPEFFEFYDGRMGTGALLSLPNIRGAKEDHYHGLSAQKRNSDRMEEFAKNPPPPYVPDPPYLQSGYEEMTAFAEQFEDPFFIMFFRHLNDDIKLRKEVQKEEREVDDIFFKLLDIPNLPPVRGGLNWRDALYYCYLDYVHNIIADEIHIAYDEYLFYREMGLTSEEGDYHNSFKDLCNMVYEMILEGRELSGEPRDLNF